ncbi:MAG: NADH-quinone oxidoreductase subunit L [Actinomycetota bacterium]|nr:NADH-quinone oxidoreductase subunit L [Actinomycetota bacterium]
MNPLLAAEQGAATAAASGAIQTNAWLLVALPLLGAAVLLLGGRRTDPWGHLLATAMSALSCLYGFLLFFSLLGYPAEERSRDLELFTWIPVNEFTVKLGFLLDPLSLCFVLLITFVGTLIHVYSIGYMAHDKDRRRFFAYLNLFVAAMLLLVLANDFLVLYVGWEGVGLASYLLIGFWNHNPNYAAAARKAFVVNRVGDFGLSVAIMIMFATFGATNFSDVFAGAGAGGVGTGVLTAIGLMLLLAACGKSAQFPLQSWLGDAMAGPTPVSALIHAATMVTAGVYLIVRANPIFNLTEDARLAVAIVGAVTLLFGAIIGCAKDDIKKALAASTMSQIGYMVLAAGLGPVGYAFAIAHLLTHGFFKAGMFLGAGSVMHGMNDQVDMRRFGGLSSGMKITWFTFAMGWLAIIGAPLLSGFWSKDAIIESAFVGEGWRPWVFGGVALLGAGITAFYMTRLFAMTFHGGRRWTDDVHPHESPLVMTVPMVILAFGSVFLGALLVPTGALASWLEPVVGHADHENAVLGRWPVTIATMLLVAGGAALAWMQYAMRRVPAAAPTAVRPVTVAARRDLYQDAFNEAVFMRPGQYLTRFLVFGDNRGVDGIVNGFAAFLGGTSGRLRRLQTGFVRSYALSMFGGAAVAVAALLLVRL